eukprot:6061-Heterococcus_DN1.PRE.3
MSHASFVWHLTRHCSCDIDVIVELRAEKGAEITQALVQACCLLHERRGRLSPCAAVGEDSQRHCSLASCFLCISQDSEPLRRAINHNGCT